MYVSQDITRNLENSFIFGWTKQGLRACLDPKSLHPKIFGCKLYIQVGV